MTAETLSLREAADMLGIGERTAYDLARTKGELVPGVRVFPVASLWKVSRKQLESFINDGVENTKPKGSGEPIELATSARDERPCPHCGGAGLVSLNAAVVVTGQEAP